MGKLTIQEVAKILVEKNGLTNKDANRFASEFFAVIQQHLQKDELVKVKGLGTFKIIEVEARESVNVRTGERIVIDSHSKVTFTPDNTMKELVNKPFSQFETVVLNDGVEFNDIQEDSTEQSEEIAEVPQSESVEEPKPETVEETPAESVEETPTETVEETPAESVEETPSETVVETPAESVEETPTETVEETPVESVEVPQASPAVNPLVPPAVKTEERPAIVPVIEQVIEPVVEPVAEPVTEVMEPSAEEQQEQSVSQPAATKDGAPRAKSKKTPTPKAEPVEEPPRVSEEPAKTSEEVVAPEADEPVVDIQKVEHHYGRWFLVIMMMVATTTVGTYLGYEFGRRQSLPVVSAPVIVRDTVYMAEQTDAVAAPENVTAPEKVAEKEKPAVVEEPLDVYAAKDDRVRLGAYRIVGTALEVTITKGQSFRKICRAHLGPDMECYVEAYNNLPRNPKLKVGDKIKIPKLELKKTKK